MLRRFAEAPDKGLPAWEEILEGLQKNKKKKKPQKNVASKLSSKIQLGVGAGWQSGEWGERIQGKCKQR